LSAQDRHVSTCFTKGLVDVELREVRVRCGHTWEQPAAGPACNLGRSVRSCSAGASPSLLLVCSCAKKRGYAPKSARKSTRSGALAVTDVATTPAWKRRRSKCCARLAVLVAETARSATTCPGAPHCNIIEAPWLVNGGHGASLRHHNVTSSPWLEAPALALAAASGCSRSCTEFARTWRWRVSTGRGSA
jgi:hypothetical protein